MKQLTLATLLIMAFAITFTACKKGDVGPAGPAGPQGPAGPKGDTGTANAIWSAWQYATNLRDSIIDNSKCGVADLAAPALTSTRLANSAILVYFTFGSSAFPLPYTSNAGGKVSTISFIPLVNKILITRFTIDNTNSVLLSTLLQYRYVITQYFHAPPSRPSN